ncbi:hypothetical protein M5J14_08105 [Lysinibacillus sp. OL1_EC]|nr:MULTISPECIES: hypothetical protein [unclassified Lysinibacillus]MCM0624489.1 hypothetical protein [Lysinibacillus sp. OL1_EC]
MDLQKINKAFSKEEIKQLISLFEKYSKEEIEIALRQISKNKNFKS